MPQAKVTEFPTPREQAIEDVKRLQREGTIDEYDAQTRLAYLEAKDDDWMPGSAAAVEAHHDRRREIEDENRRLARQED